MIIKKKSSRQAPKISLVLLDWSVRESFHLLHYLKKQTFPRNDFEINIIEFYSRVSPAILQVEDQVDTWVLMEMPEEDYYHKHLMYNVGFVYSKGDIIVICDSDAMVKDTFLQSIIEQFEKNSNIVLHLDQFRNNRKDFYPFCYPGFEAVISKGCINYKNGKTLGLADETVDPLHNRNYGACLCAKRNDLIAIGGADEHIDFVGHICGPYDLTFRLINAGKNEVWHNSEFLYHTWHPGQAGENNYLGPHDGRHMSTTSLDALVTKRIEPHVINLAIEQLQKEPNSDLDILSALLINPQVLTFLQKKVLEDQKRVRKIAEENYKSILYMGFQINKVGKHYEAYLLISYYISDRNNCLRIIKDSSLIRVKQRIKSKSHLKIIAMYVILIMVRISQIVLNELRKAGSFFKRKVLFVLNKLGETGSFFKRKVLFVLNKLGETGSFFKRKALFVLNKLKEIGFHLKKGEIKKKLYKGRQLFLESKELFRKTSSLMGNMVFSAKVKGLSYIILAEEPRDLYIMKTFIICRLIRNTRIVHVKEGKDLKACLEGLKNKDEIIFVTKCLYIRFIAFFKRTERVVIVI